MALLTTDLGWKQKPSNVTFNATEQVMKRMKKNKASDLQ